jgi:hypothetical protein
MKAIVEAVQPYRARTINPASEIDYFKELIMELQTDICRSHEVIARLWLNTSFGAAWLNELSIARKANSVLPRATPERIAEDFEFSPQEISSLWTPILAVAHPDHWNEQSWESEAAICDDYIYESMEAASYNLIAKMVTGLHIGVRAHRTTNVTARLKMLAAISTLETPDRWPELPVDGVSLPDTPEGWKAFPDFYRVSIDNPAFAGIFARFGDRGTELCKKVVGKPFPERPQSPTPTPADTDKQQPDRIDLTQQPDKIDLTQQAESSQNGPQIPGSNDSSQAAHSGTPQDPQPLKTEPNADEYDIYDQEELLLDQDGKPFVRATYDDEDEPGQSSWIHTGEETDKHDNDALQYLARVAGASSEDDYRILNQWLAYNQPDLGVITTRAFELARLGGLGLARYAMDDMATDADMYGRIAQQFARKRVERLAEAAALAEVLKLEKQRLAEVEAEASKYRIASGVVSTTQQDINQTRRLMSKVQAQIQGARISMAGPAGGIRTNRMAPPSRRGSDTPILPARTPGIEIGGSSRQILTPRGRPADSDPLQTPTHRLTPTPRGRSAPDSDPALNRRRSGADFDESDWAT